MDPDSELPLLRKHAPLRYVAHQEPVLLTRKNMEIVDKVITKGR